MRVLAWPARKTAHTNPYQKLLYDAVEASGRAEIVEFSPATIFLGPHMDVLHLHWPDSFLAVASGWRFWARYGYLRLMAVAARLRGTKLVWTAHNLRRAGQGNAALIERLFWPWFLRRIDGVIFMTEASAAAGAALPELEDTPRAVIPHGHYLPVIPSPADPGGVAPEAPPQLLFFGAVNAYKNVYKVLEAVLQIPPGRARLQVSGKLSASEPDTRFVEGMSQLPAARRGEIAFDNRFLPDDELVSVIRASDLVVLPYSGVLNSGAAIFALSAGRPILATDTGLFRELQSLVGSDWVRLIEGEPDGAQLLTALEAARALRAGGAGPDLSALDWEEIADRTVAFYESVARS